MSLLCRLITRRTASCISRMEKCKILSLVKHITIKASPYQPPPTEGHDEKNMKIGRPQSPHLSIYARQMTSILSASHRITGFAITGYCILLAIAGVVLPEPISFYIDLVEDLSIPSAALALGKFVLAFPFCYHACNGMRHLIWDLGMFLTIKGVYATGYIMLISAFSSAALLAIL